MSVVHCLTVEPSVVSQRHVYGYTLFFVHLHLLYIFIYSIYMPTASSIVHVPTLSLSLSLSLSLPVLPFPPPLFPAYPSRARFCHESGLLRGTRVPSLTAFPEALTPRLKFPEDYPPPVPASVLPRPSPVLCQPFPQLGPEHTLTTRREEARIRDKIVHVLPHLTEEAYGYLLGEKSQQQ